MHTATAVAGRKNLASAAMAFIEELSCLVVTAILVCRSVSNILADAAVALLAA